jgi:phosphoadenosine phosphosulfate reductase
MTKSETAATEQHSPPYSLQCKVQINAMVARRHSPKNSNPHSPITTSQSTSSSEFESNISIMVDPLPQPRRRKWTLFFRHAFDRCMSTRIAVVRRVSILMMLFGGVLLMTGRTQWRTRIVKTARDEKANELLQALYELELPSSEVELVALNEELASLDPKFILQWAHHAFSTTQNLRHSSTHPFVQVTSFGPTGLVILHLLSRLRLLKDVPVITLDTLHLFKESYDFFDSVQQHPDFDQMKLTITKPIDDGHFVIKSRNKFDEKYNGLWKSDPKRYTKLTKQDPLEQVFREWQVKMWITGRRRSQGGERSNMQVLEFEYNGDINTFEADQEPFHHSKGRWKLNPLAFWSYDKVWRYIREQNIPYNVLYDQGYTSLGDEMTTRLPDMNDVAFERSGRFVGLNQTECGLHSHRAKVNAQKEEAAAAGKEWKVPELICEKCIDLGLDNFEQYIRDGKDDLVLEFFSPYCGGCQEFAPTMVRLAEYLTSRDPSIKVLRFDITEHDPPLIDGKKVFEVEATPTLFRVKYQPFSVELYTGEHEYQSILRWLGKL